MFGVRRISSLHEAPSASTAPAPVAAQKQAPARLPRGECRFILLHPENNGQRCCCQGFWHNEGRPGATCECGHQACYHEPELANNGGVTQEEHQALMARVVQLEQTLSGEWTEQMTNLGAKVTQLEESLDTLSSEREEEIRGVYQAVQGVYQQIQRAGQTQTKLLTSQDDKVDAMMDKFASVGDDVRTLRERLIHVDDANMALEDRLNAYDRREIHSDHLDHAEDLKVAESLNVPLSDPDPEPEPGSVVWRHPSKRTKAGSRDEALSKALARRLQMAHGTTTMPNSTEHHDTATQPVVSTGSSPDSAPTRSLKRSISTSQSDEKPAARERGRLNSISGVSVSATSPGAGSVSTSTSTASVASTASGGSGGSTGSEDQINKRLKLRTSLGDLPRVIDSSPRAGKVA